MAFDSKKGHGLLSRKLAQNRLIWNIFVVLSKISLMGHFSHSVFVKKYKFHIKTLKNWEMWVFESHYALKHVRGQWISKIYVSQFLKILIWNLYFLTKIEWEKCPISHILDKRTKIFQIRRFCASLRDNKPWPFLVSKAI